MIRTTRPLWYFEGVKFGTGFFCWNVRLDNHLAPNSFSRGPTEESRMNHASGGDVTLGQYAGKSEAQLRAGWQTVAAFIYPAMTSPVSAAAVESKRLAPRCRAPLCGGNHKRDSQTSLVMYTAKRSPETFVRRRAASISRRGRRSAKLSKREACETTSRLPPKYFLRLKCEITRLESTASVTAISASSLWRAGKSNLASWNRGKN